MIATALIVMPLVAAALCALPLVQRVARSLTVLVSLAVAALASFMRRGSFKTSGPEIGYDDPFAFLFSARSADGMHLRARLFFAS